MGGGAGTGVGGWDGGKGVVGRAQRGTEGGVGTGEGGGGHTPKA